MNRKAALLVFAVFLLGVAAGALGFYAYDARIQAAKQEVGNGRSRHVQRLTMELGLSPEQQTQLQAILDETKSRYDALYAPIRPQMDAARKEGRQKIRGILTAEQLPAFEEYLRKLDEERKRKGR
jgi:Spy/CpxP family protein refolding chaperone